MMKYLVVGYGVQGKKRVAAAGDECIGFVDLNHPEALSRDIKDVPLADFDAVFLCTPEDPKLAMMEYFLSHKKHVLVEKPLLAADNEALSKIAQLATANGVACYTAYNHRYEPAIQKAKAILDSGKLGKVYVAKMYYGNGTARNVRDSKWRDHGVGVLHDLGSHLLDLTSYLLGHKPQDFRPYLYNNYENRSFDYFNFGANEEMGVRLEVSLLAWKNTFTIDLVCEKGSLHLNGLCKWGVSHLEVHERLLPSGKPLIEGFHYERPDPTWQAEKEVFEKLCLEKQNQIANDIWINDVINRVAAQVGS